MQALPRNDQEKLRITRWGGRRPMQVLPRNDQEKLNAMLGRQRSDLASETEPLGEIEKSEQGGEINCSHRATSLPANQDEVAPLALGRECSGWTHRKLK